LQKQCLKLLSNVCTLNFVYELINPAVLDAATTTPLWHIKIFSGINLGKGHSHDLGSSGAGHGGTSGTGKHQIKTGQPYGDLYEPRVFGSAGGTSSYLPATNERYYVPGGRGGGVLYLNVSDTLSVNGEITADGKAPAEGHHAGGGSGGSILIHTNRFANVFLYSCRLKKEFAALFLCS